MRQHSDDSRAILIDKKIAIADDDSQSLCAQYMITSETNTASFGELGHVLNFETETIHVKFETQTGEDFIRYIIENSLPARRCNCTKLCRRYFLLASLFRVVLSITNINLSF